MLCQSRLSGGCAIITQAKQTPERSWLSGPSNVVLQQSVRDLDQAFRNWWASLKGKRKGPKVRAPRFKKRRGAQSIRFMSQYPFRGRDAHRANPSLIA
jgi:putative transposase